MNKIDKFYLAVDNLKGILVEIADEISTEMEKQCEEDAVLQAELGVTKNVIYDTLIEDRAIISKICNKWLASYYIWTNYSGKESNK